MDGYNSYMTILFHKLVNKNEIVLFHLLIHFIYQTQPLDMRVFKPFKHYHIDAMNKVVWLDNKKFEKLKFFASF